MLGADHGQVRVGLDPRRERESWTGSNRRSPAGSDRDAVLGNEQASQARGPETQRREERFDSAEYRRAPGRDVEWVGTHRHDLGNDPERLSLEPIQIRG